jgi:carbonic anhydrase/acetyltransferase-like protein (isoleucine patch superfamily)
MPLLSLNDVRPSVPAEGRYWVAPDAMVVGNVRLEDDASIWFGAVLRGDNELISIGAKANVQDLCVLHTDPNFPLSVGAHCTIGHRAILHGCTVGEESLVGMGAIILNGARIGRHCLIGAGALVPEGKVIPDGSMVIGVPGKVARELTPEEVERLGRSAETYARNWKRFASGLSAAS